LFIKIERSDIHPKTDTSSVSKSMRVFECDSAKFV